METFSIRDLRERVGELTQQLETGHLSVITKHGQPIAVTVPVDETLLKSGAMFAIAMRLYSDGKLSGAAAGRLCAMSRFEFYAALADHGVPVVDYSAAELQEEVQALG